MSGIKFIHIIPYFLRATKSGGPAIALNRLATSLIELGNDVTVVCSTGNLDSEVDIRFDGDVYYTQENDIPTIYFRRNKFFLPPTYYYSPSLAKWLDKHLCEYDVVTLHGTWTYFSLAGWRACRTHHKPYLQYVHGYLDPWAFNYHRWKKAPYWYGIERRIFNQASGIVAVTLDEIQYVKQKGIQSPIRLIPYGVSLKQHHQVYPIDIVYTKWSQLKDSRYILFMSRLHEKKGIDLLLPAWAKLHYTYPEYKLVIAGGDEGGYQLELESMQNRLEIKNSVVFTGYVSGEIKNCLLENASLFILPSYSEGLPNAVLEAMAASLPVIITPGCHLPEVEQYKAGLIVTPDISSIIDALQKLLSNPELLKQMGDNAYQLVQSEFSQEKMGKKFEAWSMEIIENVHQNA